MTSKLKPAVGYIRKSSDQQQDSPERQRSDIKTLAERSGFAIIKWYEDHGQTGTESSKRKDFQKLLADAKAGAFCAVLLSEQSRMSREDIFDCMQHWRLFRDAGVSIITSQHREYRTHHQRGRFDLYEFASRRLAQEIRCLPSTEPAFAGRRRTSH